MVQERHVAQRNRCLCRCWADMIIKNCRCKLHCRAMWAGWTKSPRKNTKSYSSVACLQSQPSAENSMQFRFADSSSSLGGIQIVFLTRSEYSWRLGIGCTITELLKPTVGLACWGGEWIVKESSVLPWSCLRVSRLEVDTLGLLEGIGATFDFPTPSRWRYLDRIREDSDVRSEDSRLLLLIFVVFE
jgi:hypothetical protein